MSQRGAEPAESAGIIGVLRAEIAQLWEANRALVVERDAADALLGRALDLLREYGLPDGET